MNYAKIKGKKQIFGKTMFKDCQKKNNQKLTKALVKIGIELKLFRKGWVIYLHSKRLDVLFRCSVTNIDLKYYVKKLDIQHFQGMCDNVPKNGSNHNECAIIN